jgi:hypothetical protein
MESADRYEKQFTALMTLQKELLARYRNSPGDNLGASQATFVSMLEKMGQFANKHFGFFLNGFTSGKLHVEVSAKDSKTLYPAEHVLASIISQITSDLITIQLAAEQRITNVPDKLLEQTARLAELALWTTPQPSTFYEYEPGKPQILTYFTDSVKVRVMPYHSVALVGIPYTFSDDLRGAWAVALEVGHACFWYPFKALKLQSGWENLLCGRVNLRELFFEFKYEPSAVEWAEEIFADAYAVVFGGVPAILSAMDMALEYSDRVFGEFDYSDPHPTPLIRPLLMIKALDALSPLIFEGTDKRVTYDMIESYVNDLYKRWMWKLEERHVVKVISEGEPLKMAFVDKVLEQHMEWSSKWPENDLGTWLPVDDQLQRAIRALNVLFKNVNPSIGELGWSEEIVGGGADVKKIYDETMRVRIGTLVENSKAGAEPKNTVTSVAETKGDAEDTTDCPKVVGETPKDPSKLWEEWVEAKRYFPDGMPAELWAGEFDTVMNPRNRGTKPGSWLPLFGAGGWVTGPCGSGKHYSRPKS